MKLTSRWRRGGGRCSIVCKSPRSVRSDKLCKILPYHRLEGWGVTKQNEARNLAGGVMQSDGRLESNCITNRKQTDSERRRKGRASWGEEANCQDHKTSNAENCQGVSATTQQVESWVMQKAGEGDGAWCNLTSRRAKNNAPACCYCYPTALTKIDKNEE